jgi:hypothetical protein
MGLTTDFIGELVRDANRMEPCDAFQKRRMFERAVATIAELREAVGLPTGPGRDIVLIFTQRLFRSSGAGAITTRLVICFFGLLL